MNSRILIVYEYQILYQVLNEISEVLNFEIIQSNYKDFKELKFDTWIDKFLLKKNFLRNTKTKKNGIINKKFGYKNSINLIQKFPLHLIYELN